MKFRKIFLSTILILFILVSFGCQEAEENLASDKMNSFINEFNENSSTKFSGVVLMTKENEILISNSFGFSNYEQQIENTLDTIFPIGSITKSFTATAIMDLVEQEKISINDNISLYLDGFDDAKGVLIHHLLTHTSGLPREGKVSFSKGIELQENVSYICDLELLFSPGNDFSYSNAGYILLAAIIEEVSDLSYNEYIKQNIFNSLDMATSIGGADATYMDNQAIGYSIINGNIIKEDIYDLSIVIGSGNIYSTVNDLDKYIDSYKNEKILNSASIKDMLFPHWGDKKNGYGYGWELFTDNDYEVFAHGGTIGRSGYNSYISNYPSIDLSLIILSNTSSNTALNIIKDSLIAMYFGEDVVVPKKVNNSLINDEELRELAGTYYFNDNYAVDVSYKDSCLYITADDNKLYKLLPVLENTFQYEGKEWIEASFNINKDKVVLTVKNINKSFQFERINK